MLKEQAIAVMSMALLIFISLVIPHEETKLPTIDEEIKEEKDEVLRTPEQPTKKERESGGKEHEENEGRVAEKTSTKDGHVQTDTLDNGEVKTLTVNATFYSANCKGCTGLVYANGYDVRDTVYYNGMRIVAVDPNFIPLYSILEFNLEGVKVKAIALDIGGAIDGNDIDILVQSQEKAMNLGVKTKEVKVIRWGKGE